MADTEKALERAGYLEVDVTLRSGGGIDVARVDASPSGPPPAERAAEVVWSTLPVRFDQLVVSVGPDRTSVFGYEALAARFGPRHPALDRRQVSEEVVADGLELMLLLTVGAAASVAGVVGAGLLVLRAARARRGRPPAQDEEAGPTSGLDVDSPTAGDSAADGPEAIPS